MIYPEDCITKKENTKNQIKIPSIALIVDVEKNNIDGIGDQKREDQDEQNEKWFQ